MKIFQFLLISSIIYLSLENNNYESELSEACEKIVWNFKRDGNLDKLDEAILVLFASGIKDQYTECISKWLLTYQYEKYKDTFIKIIWKEQDGYYETAHYEVVTEQRFRETIKKFM